MLRSATSLVTPQFVAKVWMIESWKNMPSVWSALARRNAVLDVSGTLPKLNMCNSLVFLPTSWLHGELRGFLRPGEPPLELLWELAADTQYQALFIQSPQELTQPRHPGSPPCGACSRQQPAGTASVPACSYTASSPPWGSTVGLCRPAAFRHRFSPSVFQSLSVEPLKDRWCYIFHSVPQWKYLCVVPGKRKHCILLFKITEERDLLVVIHERWRVSMKRTCWLQIRWSHLHVEMTSEWGHSMILTRILIQS